MSLSSPYEGLYEPVDGAISAWRFRYRNIPAAADALTDWESSTAADGRPLHVARVAGPDAAARLTGFVNGSHVQGVRGVQQNPVLDYSVPGRIACLWLLNGEWIELWAPDAHAPAPAVKPATGLTPAMADVLLTQAIGRPSGRLVFTRRTKTPKETSV